MMGAPLAAWLPVLILFAAPLVLLLAIGLKRSFALTGAGSIALLAAAFVSLIFAWRAAQPAVFPLIVLDGFSYFLIGLFVALGILIALVALRYFREVEERGEEFFVLLLLAVLGAAIVVAARHLVAFFLGLEILSVSLYALVGYPRRRLASIEAGLKYLILAAVSAAFLLFGLALLYFDTGTMVFEELGRRFAAGGPAGPLSIAGLGLIIVGLGFKLALVPFHMWTPDVYQGAPAPVTALVASVSKGALFGFLLRFFGGVEALRSVPLRTTFIALAVLSMFAGNLLALGQARVKRLLAYSSIAHLGYLVVAFLASGALGLEAAAFYLVAYSVTIVGAFGVVAALSPAGRDADDPRDFEGLFWRRPALAVVFTAMLLSLAGIPLTAGFVGKFLIVAAGAGAGLWALVLILVANSALSLYYYLRVIVTMYSGGEALPAAEVSMGRASRRAASLAAGVALAALLVALLWLGLFPAGLIHLIRATVSAALGWASV